MEKGKDGGPAFPAVATYEDGLKSYCNEIHGMSLRDWFAGMALQGHLSNPKTTEHPSFDRDGLANECFQMADALLKSRDQEGGRG